MSTKRLFDRGRAEAAMRDFLEAIGEDLTDENVRDTPQRVTKMYCDELLSGHTLEPSLKAFPTKEVGNSFVVMSNLDVRSMCCHHLMPVTGVAHIGAYFEQRGDTTTLPGLSKYQRVVNKYARRLQLQERMCKQIADEIVESLAANWVIVLVRAQHHCMIHRGVQAVNSRTSTTSISHNYTPRAEGIGPSTLSVERQELHTRLKTEFLQEVALAVK